MHCRGMGRQGQLGIYNFVGFWGIGVVCGYYLAFHVGWGLEGLWTGILMGVVITGCGATVPSSDLGQGIGLVWSVMRLRPTTSFVSASAALSEGTLRAPFKSGRGHKEPHIMIPVLPWLARMAWHASCRPSRPSESFP